MSVNVVKHIHLKVMQSEIYSNNKKTLKKNNDSTREKLIEILHREIEFLFET